MVLICFVFEVFGGKVIYFKIGKVLKVGIKIKEYIVDMIIG